MVYAKRNRSVRIALLGAKTQDGKAQRGDRAVLDTPHDPRNLCCQQEGGGTENPLLVERMRTAPSPLRSQEPAFRAAELKV